MLLYVYELWINNKIVFVVAYLELSILHVERLKMKTFLNSFVVSHTHIPRQTHVEYYFWKENVCINYDELIFNTYVGTYYDTQKVTYFIQNKVCYTNACMFSELFQCSLCHLKQREETGYFLLEKINIIPLHFLF